MSEAIAGRGSWTRPGEGGTGSLTVVGEATRVAAAWGRLDAAARRAKAAGDMRTLAQLRSDLHLDLLLVGQLPGTCTDPGHTRSAEPPGEAPPPPANGRAGGDLPAQPALPTPQAATPDSAPTEPPVPPDPEASAPPVCTSCGVVSSDWMPLPQIGEPVLPPARCTVVVGLDVLVENAVGPSAGQARTSDPPERDTGSPGRQRGGPADRQPDPASPNSSPPGDSVSLPEFGPPVTPRSATGGFRGTALGWMPGFGYLDPDHVRAVATREGSVWQRLVADPVSGHAVAVSPHTYRPTASVARFVRARDGIARDPGSGTPAEQCELDHVTPFAEGGTTTPENLQCLTRRGHARKTRRDWTATARPGGTIEWTTLLGTTLTTAPHDYTDQ